MYNVHALMRDEKEGRKKQARSNKQQGKATQHTQGSHCTHSDSFICFATEAIDYSPYGDAMSMISDLPIYYIHIKSQASEYWWWWGTDSTQHASTSTTHQQDSDYA